MGDYEEEEGDQHRIEHCRRVNGGRQEQAEDLDGNVNQGPSPVGLLQPGNQADLHVHPGDRGVHVGVGKGDRQDDDPVEGLGCPVIEVGRNDAGGVGEERGAKEKDQGRPEGAGADRLHRIPLVVEVDPHRPQPEKGDCVGQVVRPQAQETGWGQLAGLFEFEDQDGDDDRQYRVGKGHQSFLTHLLPPPVGPTSGEFLRRLGRPRCR